MVIIYSKLSDAKSFDADQILFGDEKMLFGGRYFEKIVENVLFFKQTPRYWYCPVFVGYSFKLQVQFFIRNKTPPRSTSRVGFWLYALANINYKERMDEIDPL